MPFALLTLFVWIGSASCGSPSVRFAVQLYEVHLNLAPDGSVEVHERIALRVGADAARAFERRVTGERVDGFRDVSASIDGQPATAGGGPGQVTIEPGRNLTVGWLLGPASDASHVLDLRYRATGVVEIQGMRGTFRWQVLPEPRNYDINEARLSLVLPQGTRPLVAPTIDAPGWQWAGAPDRAVAVKTAVSHDESALVTTELALDSVPMAEPEWQVSIALGRQLVPAFIAAGLFILVTGAGILWVIRLQFPRRTGHADGAGRPEVAKGLHTAGLVVVILGVTSGAIAYATLRELGPWSQSMPVSLVVVGLMFAAAGSWFKR